MKAIRLHAPADVEQLIYEEAPMPALGSSDALVRVHACAITPTELTWSETSNDRSGSSRLPSVPGHEVSGVVEKLGPYARGVRVGDAVYALTDFARDGGAAEYVAIRADDLAPKPKTLYHVHASAVPLSALTAWQALFDHAHLSKGQHVLIHGAAGGVGTFAVQLARFAGARVTATAGSDAASLVRDLGADEVVDYRAVRFEDVAHDVDVVLDMVGGATLDRSWGTLRRGGTLVTLAGDAPAEKAAQYGVRALYFIVEPSRDELIRIGELVDRGLLRVIVQDVVPLARGKSAFVRALQGHNRGKIVLDVIARAATRQMTSTPAARDA